MLIRSCRFQFSVIYILSCVAAAASAAPVKFDIPTQPAVAALQLFGRQAAVEVLFPAAELKPLKAVAVKGELEPLAALNQLLAGTGYAAEQTGPHNFVVAKIKAATTGSVRGALILPNGPPAAGVLVTVRETGQSAETDKAGQFFFSAVAPGSHVLVARAEGYQPLHITDVVVKAGNELALSRETLHKPAEGLTVLEPFVVRGEAVEQLDKYSVYGARQKPFENGNMDLPRTINDAQPYYIFDAKALDQSAAVNVEDFLKQRLTMNTTIQTNGEMSGQNNLGNTSSINLRGVGTDKTLILVNGRRMAGISLGTTENQPDLNGIPLSAIDRIEVLPSSASGIYGGSAIGGVVNVVLKQNYTGGELRLSYDNYPNTDAAKRNAAFSYGMSLEGGKTHLTLNASWSDTSPLLLQDGVDVYRRNLAIIQGNSPTFLISSTIPWLGNVPNIMASPASVTTLTLKPAYGGAVLNSRNTYIPAGTSATTAAAQLAAGLLANAGQWNMDLPLTTQGPTGLLRPIGTPAQTRAFRFGLRRQMLPRWELSADFSYNENRSDSIYNPLTGALTVTAAAPTNPFTTNVLVHVPDASGVPMPTRSQSRSATIGSVVELPWAWTGSLDYSWSESRFDYALPIMDTVARNADLASGALNPFVDTLLQPLGIQKYLYVSDFKGSNRLHDVALRGNGPLPSLPWGQPILTVGLELRLAQTPEWKQTRDYLITVRSSFRDKYYARESTTRSGYAEMAIPLVKTGWLPGLHVLDLQLSGRSENYKVDAGTNFEETFYNQTPPLVVYSGPLLNGQPYFTKASYTANNSTVGLKYQPVKEVTFRVSKATAFLPPTPAQLVKNPVQSTGTTNVFDPVTQRQTAVYTLTGGNPDLKPQNSDSVNVGLIWEPIWQPLRGLRLNAEYYKIEQFDAIGTLGEQGIVNQESLYPGRVTRDSTGTITLVDNSSVNLYHRETEGWDLSAAYSLETAAGTFHLNAVQTILLHLKNQYSATQPEYEGVDYPSEGGAAKYKSNLTLTWERRGWTAGWTARYFGAYKQYGVAGGPNSMQFSNGGVYSSTYIVAGGGDTIPSQTYHDVFVGYSFREAKPVAGSRLSTLGAKLLSGLSVQLNVRNVFDKVAPLDANYGSSYYLSPYGGGLAGMRSYLLTIKKSF